MEWLLATILLASRKCGAVMAERCGQAMVASGGQLYGFLYIVHCTIEEVVDHVTLWSSPLTIGHGQACTPVSACTTSFNWLYRGEPHCTQHPYKCTTVGAAIAIYGKVCVGLLPSQHMIFTLTTVIVNLAGLVTMLMIFISHMNIIYT